MTTNRCPKCKGRKHGCFYCEGKGYLAPKTTKTDNWEKEFEKENARKLDPITIDRLKAFIRSILSLQRQEILDQVGREVVGEDEGKRKWGKFILPDDYNIINDIVRNGLRAEQRQKLSALRLEGATSQAEPVVDAKVTNHHK